MHSLEFFVADTNAIPIIGFDSGRAMGMVEQKKESLCVIVKVDEPTDSVNSITIAENKNGSLRNCLYPRDLIKAIKREHYSCPTVEDAAAKLYGAQMFTVIDATSGHWQVKLDKIPVHPTAIWNEFGPRCLPERDRPYICGIFWRGRDRGRYLGIWQQQKRPSRQAVCNGTQYLTKRDQI